MSNKIQWQEAQKNYKYNSGSIDSPVTRTTRQQQQERTRATPEQTSAVRYTSSHQVPVTQSFRIFLNDDREEEDDDDSENDETETTLPTLSILGESGRLFDMNMTNDDDRVEQTISSLLSAFTRSRS
jgi:hypothetical protein